VAVPWRFPVRPYLYFLAQRSAASALSPNGMKAALCCAGVGGELVALSVLHLTLNHTFATGGVRIYLPASSLWPQQGEKHSVRLANPYIA
jgi:hypothetical protein